MIFLCKKCVKNRDFTAKSRFFYMVKNGISIVLFFNKPQYFVFWVLTRVYSYDILMKHRKNRQK